MACGSNTMVEHTPRCSMVEGLSPATAIAAYTGQWLKNFKLLLKKVLILINEEAHAQNE
jgi:hypothetical protein